MVFHTKPSLHACVSFVMTFCHKILFDVYKKRNISEEQIITLILQ